MSLKTWIASGFTLPVGNEPALYTSNCFSPIRLSKYSPRMLRADLPVQRNKVLYGPEWSFTSVSFRGSCSELCGTTTAGASTGNEGMSHRNKAVAPAAPRSCAVMKPGTSVGRIPAKVSLADRASVTAGLANDVDEVNQ